MKTWQGRIATKSDPLFESFTSSIVQDRRLAAYDVHVSRAHARALALGRAARRSRGVTVSARLDGRKSTGGHQPRGRYEPVEE